MSPVRPSNLVAGVLFVSSDVAYVCGEHVDREKSRLPTEIPSRITLTQDIWPDCYSPTKSGTTWMATLQLHQDNVDTTQDRNMETCGIFSNKKRNLF